MDHSVIPKGGAVYVVEDDASLCKALRRLLRSAHHHVLVFSSAEEFYQSNSRNEPGCLLLDIQMPGISGFELQERLLDSGARIPVIFITGLDSEGMEERAMRLGASAYLLKPVDDETLLGAIHLAMKSLANGKE